ncbi:MAG: hypothetical protein P8170_02330 [Gemmatimonadota bacterium]|jgi:hypothetical protein
MGLRFSDGLEIDTGGPLRIWSGPDGLYVVGRGWLIPCENRGEAEETLREMQARLEKGGAS